MTELSSAPVKPRITHAVQERWREDARGFVQNGETTAMIDAWLKEEGCPPRLRQELIRHAQASERNAHRGTGLRLLGAGLGVLGLGGMLLWGVLVGLHPPDDGQLHNVRLLLVAAVVSACGVPLVVFGIWKMLTGQAVDVTARL